MHGSGARLLGLNLASPNMPDQILQLSLLPGLDF